MAQCVFSKGWQAEPGDTVIGLSPIVILKGLYIVTLSVIRRSRTKGLNCDIVYVELRGPQIAFANR